MGYYLMVIGQGIMSLLLIFLCLYAFYLFVKSYRRYMLTDMFFAFRPSAVRGKGRILLLALVLTMIYGSVAALALRQTSTVSIALTYPEASSGVNPNGSRYNMSEVLSEEVLEEAIQFGGFTGVTAADLQQCLDITPMDGAGLEGAVATQFFLSFYSNARTSHLDSQEVLYAVSSAYRDWFIKTYSANDNTLEMSFEDLGNYDYPDVVDYLRNSVVSVCNYASAYANESSTYRSPSTRETFQSISQKGWDIYNTGMESLEAFVLSKGLSRNEGESLSRLRYNFTNNCNVYRNNIQAYDVRIEAIEKYDNDMATVVYIPTYDTDDTFYMSKTKIGIDHFSADADVYSDNASTVLSTLQDDKYLMQQLRTTPEDASAYEKADQMIAELQEQISALAKTMKKTLQEYIDDTYNGYMTVSEPLANFGDSAAGIVLYGCAVFALLYIIRVFKLLNRKDRKIRGRDGI